MNRKVIFLICVFFFLFGINPLAHGGRTDSNGGHNCSQKSQAKGLCSGYHYHNTGESSSGDSSSNRQPAVNRNDKDCSDFTTYDELIDYWNSKGYSATYDPENLDGWGNGQVDDGIPCEAPSGYDKAKIDNSPEQIQFQQEQADTDTGESQGYNQGLKDGYAEAETNDSISKGTDAFISGYNSGYRKGYEEGKQKITSAKTNATNDGYALAQKQDKLVIPKAYSKHSGLMNAFKNGFDKAVTERIEAKKKEYQDLGYTDGKEDTYSPPQNIQSDFVEYYQVGYDKAQEELKNEYYDKGYEAAFKMLEFKDPKFPNNKFTQWYRNGFNSNKEVLEIKDAGYLLGEEGKRYSIPSKLKKGEEIFKYYYQEGYKQYKDEKKRNQTTAASGIGLVTISWLGRRLYIAKKMIT